jgi:putative heme iron utilization protein
VILSEKIQNTITSKKYSIINYALSTGQYTDFVKLDEKVVTFNSADEKEKDESNLYTFEAKYNPETPKRKFIQTAKVCGDMVYLMTIGVNLDVSDMKKYEAFLTSFECSAKKTEK